LAKPSYAAAVRGFDWSAVLRDLGWRDGEPIIAGDAWALIARRRAIVCRQMAGSMR
jgi:hypothetical protein